jgi:regulator of sirC expression with transglutaminase-like and TPR domain
MIDPSIDVRAGVKQIDEMAAQIRAMSRPSASSAERLQALQRYLYEKGPWNGYQPFGYDFDDPAGNNISNKLLPNYIKSRKGNCVTMPVLFVILGQRLDLDVTLSTAPLHLFVKYTDAASRVAYNLESTSGAKPARDVWIRQQNPMTDVAIANGIYMQKLSKRKSAAVMATTLSEYLAQGQKYDKVIAVSDVILAHYPKEVGSMLSKGNAYGRLATAQLVRKGPHTDAMPPKDRGYFEYLAQQNRIWFAKAETLGWREPSQEQEASYIQTITRKKSAQ